MLLKLRDKLTTSFLFLVNIILELIILFLKLEYNLVNIFGISLPLKNLLIEPTTLQKVLIRDSRWSMFCQLSLKELWYLMLIEVNHTKAQAECRPHVSELPIILGG